MKNNHQKVPLEVNLQEPTEAVFDGVISEGIDNPINVKKKTFNS